MIGVSAEVRWFGTGDPPPGLDALFDAAEPSVRAEEPREDAYLDPDPAWHEIGLKMRNGAMEAKAPVDAGRSIALPGLGAVAAKGWSKWSIAPDLGDRGSAFAAAFHRSAPIAFVRKLRRLRRYVPDGEALAPGGVRGMSNADPASSPKRACAAELTRVTLRRGGREPRQGWTFGFEATGDDLDDAYAILSATLVEVAGTLDAETLARVRDSACSSYPSWLSEQAGRNRRE